MPAQAAENIQHGRICSEARLTDYSLTGIFTFLVVEITPVSITNIQWRTYIYFGVFNFCFLPLIYFYPETRNLTLEQIDKLFTGDRVKMHWDPSMGSVEGLTTGSPEGEKEAAVQTEIAERRD